MSTYAPLPSLHVCAAKSDLIRRYVAALESRLRMFESTAAATNPSQPVACQVHEDVNASPQANSSPLSPPPRYSGEERLQQNVCMNSSRLHIFSAHHNS